MSALKGDETWTPLHGSAPELPTEYHEPIYELIGAIVTGTHYSRKNRYVVSVAGEGSLSVSFGLERAASRFELSYRIGDGGWLPAMTQIGGDLEAMSNRIWREVAFLYNKNAFEARDGTRGARHRVPKRGAKEPDSKLEDDDEAVETPGYTARAFEGFCRKCRARYKHAGYLAIHEEACDGSSKTATASKGTRKEAVATAPVVLHPKEGKGDKAPPADDTVDERACTRVARLNELIASFSAESEEKCHYATLFESVKRSNPEMDAQMIGFAVMKEMAANPVDFGARVRVKTSDFVPHASAHYGAPPPHMQVRAKTSDLVAARDALMTAEEAADAAIARATGESSAAYPSKKVVKRAKYLVK